VTRQIQRMSYPEAAMALVEADEWVDRCRTELQRAEREREQALANVLDALSRGAT
jgi:hypothetical protein